MLVLGSGMEGRPLGWQSSPSTSHPQYSTRSWQLASGILFNYQKSLILTSHLSSTIFNKELAISFYLSSTIFDKELAISFRYSIQ